MLREMKEVDKIFSFTKFQLGLIGPSFIWFLSDFFTDLLFYHRGLQCLVAFELKADKFKPEYLGQLNFYLEALDRDVRKPNEKPSIGVLLCKDKDQEVVEYALSRTLSPTMVAEYKTQLPDKKLLQEKLHEIFENKDVEDHLN